MPSIRTVTVGRTTRWHGETPKRAEMESEDKNEDKKAGLSVHVRGRIPFNCD
jgi:hypothetical protein